MKNIVIGFGSHDSSLHTLEWAARLAKRTGAHLYVLNVFHRTYAEMSPETHDELLAKRRDRIDEIVNRVDHGDTEIVVIEGEATDELIRFAHAKDADLIVVGRTDSMAPWGFGEHGTAEALLRHSDVPFVVVNPASPLPALDGHLAIVVGLDGSQANADSIKTIASIVADSEAVGVPVLSINTGASTTRDHYGSHLIGEDEARAVAERLPGDQPLRMINESPVAGLIDAADDVDAFCIAIGTRGHRGLFDLVAGQVSRHLIHTSDRAVLVSPHN